MQNCEYSKPNKKGQKMKVIIKKEVVEHIEDLISKIEIDPSIIKFEFIKLNIENYELQKKLEDSENQVKKLKKDISLHEIKEISCAYRGCIYE